MTYVEGLVYGAVQGLTEFLPISSSAHLILVPWLFGWQDPGLGFDVAVHAGTLVAVLWYFWLDWWRLATGAFAGLTRGEPLASPEAVLFWKLVAASIPAAVAGVLLEHAAEEAFRAPALIAFTLVALGALLHASDLRPESASGLDSLGWRAALLIGVAQAAAIVPGVSRSGVTITAARFLGAGREAAARFSFLLSTPISDGAVLIKIEALAGALRRPGELVAL
ncbi:MAG: undecaprenyl-diphosphate phosphatase, partial [Candidatus Binatia bacterium]